MRRQDGFTYLTILFAIAIAGIVLAEVGVNWSHSLQREREEELLYVGNQYRQAIALYYERTPGPIKHYPEKLENLLSDNRYNPPQHYLRKLYRDPMTTQPDWELVVAPEGGIMGVHSRSNTAPIKSANFSYANQAFEGRAKYSDWVFFYRPALISSAR